MATTTARIASIGSIKLQRPLFEEIPLYRIQLKLTTGVGNGAGTDDLVFIQFNNLDQQFFLRKGIDNFEEGHTDTYDILPSNVRKIKDIQFLHFGVRGNDGICIKKVELYFNSNINPVFSKSYAGSGSCIDNDTAGMAKTLTIPGTELRASPNWKYNTLTNELWQPLQSIPREMIVNLIEAAIGHQISAENTDVAWGSKGWIDTIWGPAVEVSYVNSSTLHVDLDLQKTVRGPNPEVDVDFDLEFACNDGKIATVVRNIKIGTNWVGEAEKWMIDKGLPMLAAAIGKLVDRPGIGIAAGGMLSRFLAFSLNFNPQNPAMSVSCKTIKVTPGCSIDLF